MAAFLEAWLRKDLDGLMSHFTEDIFYGPSTGPAHRGSAAVRAAFVRQFAEDEGIEFTLDDVWIDGDRGAGEWSSKDTRGVDLYGFRGDLICRKDVFRKA